jgi:cytochrome c-type biogenesis protein CcmH/NrfG
MKREHALVSIAVAFVAGILVGVVSTVFYQERIPSIPPAVKPSPTAGAPALTADMAKQISVLQSILKDDPKNLKALIELGNIYFDLNQFDPAIQSYSKALEIDPKNADVRTDLGILFRRKGDYDKAIAEFRKAAEEDPHHVNSRYNLGVVLLHDKGDVKGAIKAWEDFLKVEPNSPRAENIRNQLGKMKSMAK